jgi:hypothetical protein
MDELITACFLFLHSYGIEPMDSVKRPIVTINTEAEIKVVVGQKALGACLDGHIYLDQSIDLKTVEGQSALCHEIVHYTQNYCPIPKDILTRDANEKQAYELQNQWLIDHGSKWRAKNPLNLYGGEEGYHRPEPKVKGYSGTSPPEPPPEAAEAIRKRFKETEAQEERRKRRGFHARFEDETLDDRKIEEYNTHTR